MLNVQVRRRLGALDLDVKFAVEDNEVLAVHGPSGSGKTTLINLLAGLERPDSGRIAIGERVLFDSETRIDVKPQARQVGYVFQDCRLFPHMSVSSNLRYGRHQGERTVEFDEVVDLLDLHSLLRRRPRFLSGGEKQRVAIGRALLSSPRILLFDEPLASLDPARKAEILPFIRRLKEVCAIPIVYVTHATAEIAAIADRTIRIDKGRLAEADRLPDAMPPISTESGLRVVALIHRHDDAAGTTELRSPVGRMIVERRSEPVGTAVQVAIGVARIEAMAPEDAADIAVMPERVSSGSDPAAYDYPSAADRRSAMRRRAGT